MKIPFPKNFKPKQPHTIKDVQEITIILFSSQIKPSQIKLSTLRQKQVIPSNWQLVKSNKSQSPVKQFLFKQGLKILIDNGNIQFIGRVNQPQVKIAQIINKFIDGFSHLMISQSQINLRRLISLPGNQNAANKFITETILNSGEWQNFYQAPMKAQVNFLYKLSDTVLIFSLTDLLVGSSKRKTQSALLFKGTFNYQFNLKSKTINSQSLVSLINDYHKNIDIFNHIITNIFLGKN